MIVVIVRKGACVKCGRRAELGDGLCVVCWDRQSEQDIEEPRPPQIRDTLPQNWGIPPEKEGTLPNNKTPVSVSWTPLPISERPRYPSGNYVRPRHVNKERNDANYRLRVRHGLCRQCGKVQAKMLCPPCRRKKSAGQKARLRLLKTAGICVACGITRTSGYVHCESCRRKRKRHPSRVGIRA